MTFLSIFAISFTVCGLLLVTKKFHLTRSIRMDDCRAVQAAHRRPTPRIGGLGVLIAILIVLLFMVPEAQARTMRIFAVSLIPTFAAGLVEDLGYRVSPQRRLLAAFASSGLVMLMLDTWITDTGLPGLDHLLLLLPFALLWTGTWTAGLCHGFNLIDGVNGLAATTGLLVSLGLAAIALQSGQPGLAFVALAMVPAILGFLVFNWPFGGIFLGDAGAYSLGHLLSWLGIFIAAGSDRVSGVSVGLLFFWPVADTFLAMYRRRKSSRPASAPDRLHFHQLVMRGIEIGWTGRSRRHLSNPLTTVVLLPLIGLPVALGVVFWDNPLGAALSLTVLGVAFVVAYNNGMRYVQRRRRGAAGRPGFVAPVPALRPAPVRRAAPPARVRA
ncbi:MraY family glycosyltransferase [Palleronia rufa]|uniref:MraY family glycosyltransferase n=1 Tax=Palleronia rufa TaxID=1530186 RepID=UPI0006907C00|nr:glycosyltransferase [Palleronia rufa]